MKEVQVMEENEAKSCILFFLYLLYPSVGFKCYYYYHSCFDDSSERLNATIDLFIWRLQIKVKAKCFYDRILFEKCVCDFEIAAHFLYFFHIWLKRVRVCVLLSAFFPINPIELNTCFSLTITCFFAFTGVKCRHLLLFHRLIVFITCQ